MENSNQHFIPSSYLKAWCDTDTPESQEPYVWVYKKDGTCPKRKAPKNTFHEKDLYTIKAQSGVRVLTMEKSLSKLESDFINLRQNKISKWLPVTEEGKLVLCTFVSAMYKRTKKQGNYMKEQLGKIVDEVQHMVDWAKTATQEELEVSSVPKMSSGVTGTFDELKEAASQPYPTMLTNVWKIAGVLMDWPITILETNSDLGFLTSDNPCVWFDVELCKPNPAFGAGGLISPSLEITMPISPTQVVCFRKGPSMPGLYNKLEDPSIEDQINRRTTYFADEFLVVRKRADVQSWLTMATH